jgi:Flp pilus assembly protein TadG
MRLSPHTRSDRGVAAIEFVIVFPFLLLILFAIVVMGGYMSAKTRLTGAVRDAARAGALSLPYTAPAGVIMTQTGTCPPRSDPTFNTTNITVHGQTTFTETSIIDMGDQTITEDVTVRCGG